jgi:hypothetical protein
MGSQFFLFVYFQYITTEFGLQKKGGKAISLFSCTVFLCGNELLGLKEILSSLNRD